MLNIARNLSIDTLRSKKLSEIPENQSPRKNDFNMMSPAVQMNVDNIGIRKVLGKLKEEYRTLIDLGFILKAIHTKKLRKWKYPLERLRREYGMPWFNYGYLEVSNIQEYINSGIVESHVLGLADEVESAEFERLATSSWNSSST